VLKENNEKLTRRSPVIECVDCANGEHENCSSDVCLCWCRNPEIKVELPPEDFVDIEDW